MLKLSRSCILSLLLLFVTHAGRAQSTPFFQSLNYSRSIISLAMGGQGAAMLNAVDAMQYNPANLIHSEKVSASFSLYPIRVGGLYRPVSTVTTALRLGDGIYAGVDFTNDEHMAYRAFYSRSLAGALAMSIGTDWAVGAQVRYAWENEGRTYDHVLFGVGATFEPEALGKRAVFGLSWMNFGTPLIVNGGSTEYSYAMPSQINLGTDYAVIRNRCFDVKIALGFTKPIDKLKDDSYYTAQSSFQALFTDWSDFPQDVITHIGLGYEWKPLSLGRGITYFQDVYLGYFTVGPHSTPRTASYVVLPPPNYRSFLTHGARVGIEIKGVRASIGYASRWHDNRWSTIYSTSTFPSETYQASLSTDGGIFGMDEHAEGEKPHAIFLSAGYSQCFQIGRMKSADLFGSIDTYTQHSSWSVESDFYVNENSAVVATLAYGRLHESLKPLPSGSWFREYETDIESLGLSSGFRYHPIGSFHPFFVQASLGIIWLNPVIDYIHFRYMYNTFGTLAAGCMIPLGRAGIVIMPVAGIRVMGMESWASTRTLTAYDQIEAGVNIGYAL